MSEPEGMRPTICLSMIVRNEAHIVHEVLDSVSPYITSWVIVDTGSDDGTQDLIRRHMAELGIPGELHERPWRNFGHNRSEALELAEGRGDYLWVIDADDLVVGKPDFSALSADSYYMLYKTGATYWRRQLFRSGMSWRYAGVVHEYPECDGPVVSERLGGDYYVESRRLGARNLDSQKYARDRDLLLAEVERDPEDRRSVFYLARSYFDLGDFANARMWFARRVEMSGWAEEVYYSLFQGAQSMERLGLPWPDVQDAYLRAWQFRPTRVEALTAVARKYRIDGEYQLGHLFAERAAGIPFPEKDVLFVGTEAHAWAAADEQAICASRIGKHAEALALCRRLVALHDIREDARQRIAGNRDFSVPAMLDTSSAYPAEPVRQRAGSGDGDVTVSLVAGPDRSVTEATLNSFLNSCLDVSRVGRILVVLAGLSAEDRAVLLERYRFLEFVPPTPGIESTDQRNRIRGLIDGRFWLHLGEGWRFFAPENYLARLTGVFEAEPQVVQVGVNFTDATRLTGDCATEDSVRRAPDAGRYVLTNSVADGPAMFDVPRLAEAGVVDDPNSDLTEQLGWIETGWRTASLDEVLCIAEAG